MKITLSTQELYGFFVAFYGHAANPETRSEAMAAIALVTIDLVAENGVHWTPETTDAHDAAWESMTAVLASATTLGCDPLMATELALDDLYRHPAHIVGPLIARFHRGLDDTQREMVEGIVFDRSDTVDPDQNHEPVT